MYIVLYARERERRVSSLDRARVAEALLQLAALEEALDLGVAADVLLADEDVGDGALARHDLEGVLGLAAVGWGGSQLVFLIGVAVGRGYVRENGAAVGWRR